MKSHYLLKAFYCLIFLLLLAGSFQVSAQTPQYSIGTNSGGNTIPFNSATYSNGRYQSLYLAGEFGTVPAGMYISRIYIRNSTAVTSLTFTNFEVRIGQSSVTALSSTAWQGSLTLAFSSASFTAGPYAIGSWIPITLTTPILYNPTQSLIIDTRHTATSGGFSVRTSTLTGNRRCYASPSTAATPASASATAYDFGFDLIAGNTSMTYDSSTVFNPNTANVYAGQSTMPVLGMSVFTSGAQNRLRFTDFDFTYTGTATQDISNVRLWHTGSNAIFDTTKQVGVTITNLASGFTITPTGNDSLVAGTNYFWLTASISSSATLCNTIDFTCTGIKVADTVRTPSVTSPPGNKVIKTQLSGTYTISQSGATVCGGTNYANFTDAVKDLNELGVSGAVTFMVDTGTFTERIVINQIVGASSSRRVHFIGSGRSTTTLTYAASSTADLATVHLNGADHLLFRDMTVSGTAPTNGVGFLLINGADSNQFRNLRLLMNVTSTSATTAGVALTGSATSLTTAGNTGSQNQFDSLSIEGAYYGITIYGPSTSVFVSGNSVTNSTFISQYYYPLRSYSHQKFTFKGNTISGGRNTVHYGIYLGYSSNYRLENNNVNSPDIGVYLTNNNTVLYDNTVTTVIANNFVKSGTDDGLYVGSTASVSILHNTVVNSSTTAASGAIYFTSATSIDCRNNIFRNSSTGSCVYVTAASTFTNLDYNNYTTTGATLVYVSASITYADLAAWRTAVPALNNNSISVTPLFVSANDLHIQVNNPVMTAPLLSILYDIDGNFRFSPTTMGADEKPMVMNDAGIAGLVSPVMFCAGNNAISVNVVNQGKVAITSLYLNWEVNGVPQTPVLWTGTIDTIGSTSGYSSTLTVASAFSFTSGVMQNLKIWTSLPNNIADSANMNDTLYVSVKPGVAAGTYTVGSGGNYSTITQALADLTYGVCGAVVLELQGNYVSTGETFPLQFGKVGSSTNTILIRPQSGASGLTITGNSNIATIDLQGTKYVTIDGRANGTGPSQLSIISNTASGACIRLMNGASYNQVRYLTVVSNNTTATSGGIVFGTSNDTIGNSFNIIDNCTLNGNSNTVNCIYSSGSVSPSDNRNNIITNNHIFDFFTNAASGNASGILLEAGNSNWQIGSAGNGNRFYQTSVRNTTSTPALTNAVGFRAIYVNHASVNGTSIVANRIGGLIPGVTGSVFEIGDNTGTVSPLHFVRAIDIAMAGTTVPTSIQGNIISNITVYSGTTGAAFAGVHALGGLVNTGNIIGNLIGDTIGNHSIRLFYKNTSTGVNIYGIRYSSGATGLIQNNAIGSYSADAATGGLQLLCIYVSSVIPSPLTISNNLIGSSTTPHSIQAMATSVAPVNVMGLCASGASGSLVSFTNNRITNLSSLNTANNTTNGLKGIYITGTSSIGTIVSGNRVSGLYSLSNNTAADQSAAVIGLNCTSSGAGVQVFENNVVHTLISASPSAAVNVIGMYYSSTTTSNENRIAQNHLYKLAATNSNQLAIINGLVLGTTAINKVSVVNNMISLGIDSSDNSLTGALTMYGILKNGAVASMLHNTIRITGAGVASTVLNTYAYRGNTSVADSLVNNMFVNDRTNSSSGGTHYAISLANSLSMTIDGNLYSASVVGLFNSVNQNAIADWRLSTGQDNNSVQSVVNFVSSNDLHLSTGSIGNPILTGRVLPHVATDFDNQSRLIATPYMGADENSIPVPVKLFLFEASAQGKDAVIAWSTQSELNASYFELEGSADGVSFMPVTKVAAKGNSTQQENYQVIDENVSLRLKSSIVYYRLKMVDLDGSFTYSPVIKVQFESSKENLNTPIISFPNPFSSDISMQLPVLTPATTIAVEVFSITGMKMLSIHKTMIPNTTILKLSEMNELADGVYFVKLNTGNNQFTARVIKQTNQ